MSKNATTSDEVVKFVRELQLLDETNVRCLQQLCDHRINEDLLESLMGGREPQIAHALFTIITEVKKPEIMGYCLRLAADLCQVSSAHVGVAFATLSSPSDSSSSSSGTSSSSSSSSTDTATRFLEIASVHSRVPGIFNPALFLAATVLRLTPTIPIPPPRRAAAETFIALVEHALSAPQLRADDIQFVMHSLSVLCRRRDYRPMIQDANLIPTIMRTLVELASTTSGGETALLTQLTYETLTVVWLLSYDYGCMAALSRAKLLPTLHRILQRAQKDKAIRMVLLILRNFTAAQRKYYLLQADSGTTEFVDPSIYHLGEVGTGKGPNFFVELIGIGTMKTLWQLSRRKFGDPDISEFIDELTSVLDQNMDVVTSFTEYRGEVSSGVLEWSPSHTSVKFWKENVGKFDSNDSEVLKELANLLMTSRNDLTLAVACHDIGEVVRYHPTGRLLLGVPQLSGVKERIMELMSHSNPEVAKNALVAVQKILVQKWDYMQ